MADIPTYEKHGGDGATQRMLYLIRHGEIQKIRLGKTYIGQLDLALTSQGRQQAQRLSEQLADTRLKAIYTSDLKRCVETAKTIAQRHDCIPILSPALREINLGRWEGLSFDKVRKEYPDDYIRRGKEIVDFRPPGGESFLDVKQRVMPELIRIFRATRGDILIVAHAGVNRIILAQAMKIDLKDLFTIPQPYGCLNHLRFSAAPLSLGLIQTC